MDFNYLIHYIPMLMATYKDNLPMLLLQIIPMIAVGLLTNPTIQMFIRTKLDELFYGLHGSMYSYEIKTYNSLDGMKFLCGDKNFKYASIEEYVLNLLKTTKVSIKTEDIWGEESITFASNVKIQEEGHDIFVNISSVEKQSAKSKDDRQEPPKVFIKTITLTSKNAEAVRAFVKRNKAEYIKKKELEKLHNNTKYIFTINDITAGTSYVNYSSYPLNSTKNFTNLFYHQKQRLLNKIDDFMNNEDRYKKLGMSYTLGLLLSGEPGTGKTSTIKAVAAYTNRHVVKINMKNIKDIQQLVKLFSDVSRHPGTEYAQVDKSILVFEDIDCSSWADIVMSRKLKEKNEMKNKDIQTIIDTTRHNTIQEIKEKKVLYSEMIKPDHNDDAKDALKDIISDITERRNKPEIKLTLAELLEWLDGVVEYSGRIIIMTSNRPELLDEALLRPGRIDLHIELGKLMKEDVNNFYKLWFDEYIPEHIYENMTDKQFTQAEIGLLFSQPDRNEIHNCLK